MHTDQHEGRPSSLARWAWREAIFLVLANHLPRLWLFDRYRAAAYRLAGLSVGRGSTIYGPVHVRPYGGCRYVTIGSDTFLNIDAAFTVVYDRVRIGDRVQIGPRVSFETMGHGLVYVPGKGRGRTSAPIVVEDEVWIGANAVILQGVTIGRGAVVAAGAVVNRDVAPYTLVGGVPARVLRDLSAPAREDGA
jgi:acetyltransferase-like isoleucine patch superfamily enzyme